MVGLEKGEDVLFLPKTSNTISIRGVEPINYEDDDADDDVVQVLNRIT